MQGTRKQTSRKGSVIYQQVLQKNFQIIETFLKKFHQIFIRQDQFQEHLNKFAQKFTEYDQNLEEFRQQQRFSLIMLQKKFNNLKVSSRDIHRSSHRWSKGNIPIFEVNQSLENGKNYTLLRFNSIEQEIKKQQPSKSSVQRKQTLQSVASYSTKQHDDMKESLGSMKQEITQMKDKINFLSAYTSNIDSHQTIKVKLESMKKQILHTLENDFNKKIQKDIRNQIIEAQNIFIQQINNLTIKASEQLKSQIQTKTQEFNCQIKKINQNIFTKRQVEKLSTQINKDLRLMADESMKTFVEKQYFRKYFSQIDKKVKFMQSQIKFSLQNSQKQKQQSQYFNSLLQINSTNLKTPKSVQKLSKSQSQWIKNRSQNLSVSLQSNDKDKQNFRKKSSQNQNLDNFSKGSLLTSQVSKDFMKNFGLKQNKLVKGNVTYFKKTSIHMSNSDPQNITLSRPFTATPQIQESLQFSDQF